MSREGFARQRYLPDPYQIAMKTGREHPEDVPQWVLWLYEHGFTMFLSMGLGALVIVSAAAFWLDERLDGLVERIERRPPQRYSPPDLGEYAATPIDDSEVVRRRSVYVPVQSHVYYEGGRPVPLEATLSIRNTSEKASIYVDSVRYYDTHGALVKKHVDQLIELKPLQTIEFLVPQKDSSGGSGANFLVDWFATTDSVRPLIEVLMVGDAGPQGISFRSVGVELPSPASVRSAEASP